MTMVNGRLADKARDEIGGELRDLASAFGERVVQVVTERVSGVTARLSEYARSDGGPGLIAAAAGARKLAEGHSPRRAVFHAGLAGGREKLMSAFGAGGGGGPGDGRKLRATTIVETIEVGVPARVAYLQWTRFGDLPSPTAKVEWTDRDSDEETTWRAPVLRSPGAGESTVVRQIPDRLIRWRSTGGRGSVDGTASFHEVGPELTRILVVLAYHPRGLLERTADLWRAPGRRVRLELRHFVRHVMTRTVLDPDAVESRRGEFGDAPVVTARVRRPERGR